MLGMEEKRSQTKSFDLTVLGRFLPVALHTGLSANAVKQS
jgi:hypothetical protein